MMLAPPNKGQSIMGVIDGNENTAQMVHHQGNESCALHPQD